MQETVLVTGASGFVGCHLVRQLLEAGWTVHGTVRSLRLEDKLKPLTDLQSRYPGQLRLFEANLVLAGSFASAMAGCTVVHHAAPPFLLPEKITDGQRQMLGLVYRPIETTLVDHYRNWAERRFGLRNRENMQRATS